MALQDVFHPSCELARYLMLPLGPEMDGYCNWFESQGFSSPVIQRRVLQVSHFNRYLHHLGLKDIQDVSRSHAEHFLSGGHWRYRSKSRGMFKEAIRSVRSFLEYLSVRGILSDTTERPSPYGSLLEEYTEYLRRIRNLRESSINTYCYYITQFLECLDTNAPLDNLRELSSTQIQALFAKCVQGKAVSTRGQIKAALKTFLCYCAKRGYTAGDLSQVLPKIFTYALSSVPRGVLEGDVEKTLEIIDRTKSVGRRYYAIIQLLWTYGVRGSQVRALELQDINWSHSRIRFRAVKGGKEVLQPLTDEVGESLLDYLRYGRPQATYSEVFLTARAPIHPLRHPSNIYNIVARHMHSAGVARAGIGPHSFRHAFATRMLGHGQSLKVIADMMGHRSINSSFIYTKVDFHMLDHLPLHWPEV